MHNGQVDALLVLWELPVDTQRHRAIRTIPAKGKPHRVEKTIVIDECSMLTMDDLLAVLEALDPAHVQRIILAGDPNQLPPIGSGRPFADTLNQFQIQR